MSWCAIINADVEHLCKYIKISTKSSTAKIQKMQIQIGQNQHADDDTRWSVSLHKSKLQRDEQACHISVCKFCCAAIVWIQSSAAQFHQPTSSHCLMYSCSVRPKSKFKFPQTNCRGLWLWQIRDSQLVL